MATDLWRVAAGTLPVPALFFEGASAPLWNPVTIVPDSGPSVRVGLTSVHAPAEVGVNGGIVAVAARLGPTTLTASWGRMGIDGVLRTETSPEALPGDVVIDAQAATLGLSRPLARWLATGIGARYSSGQLGSLAQERLGLDAGVIAAPLPRLRLAASLHAPDLTAVGSSDPLWQIAVEARSADFAALGGRGNLRIRYGAIAERGEGTQHLVAAGLVVGYALRLDAGAVRETAAGLSLWRSRIGIAVGAPNYRVEFSRAGGANGFGATYTFGITATLR